MVIVEVDSGVTGCRQFAYRLCALFSLSCLYTIDGFEYLGRLESKPQSMVQRSFRTSFLLIALAIYVNPTSGLHDNDLMHAEFSYSLSHPPSSFNERFLFLPYIGITSASPGRPSPFQEFVKRNRALL